jgi:hypothetical protein
MGLLYASRLRLLMEALRLSKLSLTRQIHATMALGSQRVSGYMAGKQLGHRGAEGFAYGDYEQTTPRKRTKGERFLAQMEAVVP